MTCLTAPLPWTSISAVTHWSPWNVFDFDEVRHAAGLAGWDPALVTRCEFQQGSDPEVAGFDLPGRRHESLYVELRA